jgi:hypothetical protein
MTLAVMIGVCFLLIALTGGDLRRLATVRLKAGWLILLALALQLLLFAIPGTTRLLAPAATTLHITSYLMLILFAALNARTPGLALALLGLTLNTTAICANGGRMPISLSTWTATGRASSQIANNGHYNNNALATAHTHLAFLGDIFPLPAAIPLANAFSIGDILLLLGATYFVYRHCKPDQPIRNRHRALGWKRS